MKTTSVFLPAELVARAKANAARYAWAKDIRDRIVAEAAPWKKMSDAKLWGLMFGPTITRSWHVWSDGHCPACKKPVPMYNWLVDPLKHAWKVRCPHCKELFPKNDFGKFYRSGLDRHGVFDPKRADRSLLFNAEKPDAKGAARTFGVDDGEGFVQGDKRWRFIGAYSVYGQWKKLVVAGIGKLAAAYVVTGDRAYAHKAAILLDRVADLYPTFDHVKQAWVYEKMRTNGYVSTWHDACEETRKMVLAYDQIRPGIQGDAALTAFLSAQAKKFALDTPKGTVADVQRNIERRILEDALANPHKIFSNFPRKDICTTVIRMVLARPGDGKSIDKAIDAMVAQTARVDGVTGEKGLSSYAGFVIQGLAVFLGRCTRARPDFLREIFQRMPNLRKTYRFHIDTHCLGRYYPLSGDDGSWSDPKPQYVGVRFTRPGTVEPSMFTFLWQLHQLTGDAAYAQVLHRANDNSVKGLPHDLFAADPKAIQKQVRDVIRREGLVPKLPSVNKEQWHIAILRSGKGRDARALWLDYDCGLNHGHKDGMNLGLFAKGLDLLPDFGYPPVNFGGWNNPRADWYRNTASHNLVVVDGKNQTDAAGKTTLWADGERFRAIRASGAGIIGGKQYERTAALIDLSDGDAYVLDIFRVVGGRDHAKFLQGPDGKLGTTGLKLAPAKDYGHGALLRNFRTDPAAKPGWRADWAILDPENVTAARLRYTDLTTAAAASVCRAWALRGAYGSTDEVWLPRLMIRRQAKTAPLTSTFVGVLEPYQDKPKIAAIRRLSLQTAAGKGASDAHVAVEVRLADGRTDLVIAAETELARKTTLIQKDWGVRLDGDLCWIRRGADGKVRRIALARGKSVTVGDVRLERKKLTNFAEARYDGGK